MEEEKRKSKKSKIIIGVLVGVLASIVLVIAVIILIYVVFIASIVNKANHSDTSNYEEELINQSVNLYGLFPEHIPEYASDVEFNSVYGIHSNEGSMTLEMTLPKEDIDEYLQKYQNGLYAKSDYFNCMPSRVRSFVGAQSPDYTISGNRYMAYEFDEDSLGFIIDTYENRILFFWDEYRCPSANEIFSANPDLITNNIEAYTDELQNNDYTKDMIETEE